MALSTEEVAQINGLARRHDAEIPELEVYDRYYEGTQPLTYMHPEILREVNERIRPVILFWPQLVADSVEERLRWEGFKTGDKGLDIELRRVWLANEMQLGFRQAVLESIVMRRAFLCVGTNEDDPETPIVTPESPLEVYVDVDPRVRRVRAALRRTSDIDPTGATAARYATLYQPTQTIWCVYNGGWQEDPDRPRDVHNLGRVPVVPLINRPRLRSTTKTPNNTTVERMGRSDLDAVIPLSDAGCKMATDMMVAGEFVAVPLRALFGIGPGDFKDHAGNTITALSAMMGRALTIDAAEVKAFEFAAAQLANFTGGLQALAQLVAAMSGLPPHYLGHSTDNPASADAIAGSESRLATRAERKQDSAGIAAVRSAALIRRFQTGKWDKKIDTARVDWRNVRTPTIGAMADAAQKLYSTTPRPIVPLRQTREKLGFEPEDIELMEEEDEKEAERQPIAAIARGFADQRVPEPANAGAGA